jgi:type I restriction enzyme S subunit
MHPYSRPTWKIRKLGDLFKIKHGFAFKGEYFSDTGPYILLTPGNFYDEGGFKYKEKEKYYTGEIPTDYVLNQGDLLIVMTEQAEGLLGSPALIPKSNLYLHNQRLGLIIDFNIGEIIKPFVYYLFKTYNVRYQIRASASGVKVRHTSPSRIYKVQVEVPDVTIQRKIATILSAYDDLIESNTHRIQILEEMAQAIYREWFIHYRFPGHENVRMVDSGKELGEAPEGWEVKRLGEIADVSWGDTSVTKASYVNDGFKAYSASGADGKLDYYDYDRKGVVLSAIGANCGVTWFAQGKWSCIKNTIRYWALSEAVSTEYLFYATYGKDIWPKRGAAQPFISQTDVQAIKILQPQIDVMKKYTEITSAILAQIDILHQKNELLHSTRNLLLPKLVSGEIDISELDVEDGE